MKTQPIKICEMQWKQCLEGSVWHRMHVLGKKPLKSIISVSHLGN